MFCVLTSKRAILYIFGRKFHKLPRSLQHILYRQAERVHSTSYDYRFRFSYLHWPRISGLLRAYFPKFFQMEVLVTGGGLYVR